MDPTPERISVACACGTRLKAPAALAGRQVKCPKCGFGVQVPVPEVALPGEPEPEPEPVEVGTPTAPEPAPPVPEGARRWIRLGLVLALVPLVLSVFTPNDTEERFARTLQANPEVAERIENEIQRAQEGKETTLHGPDDIVALFPGRRIEGAFHAQETWMHWVYALLAAAGFWGFILVAFPMGRATSRELWGVGLFIGTIGIVLLLALQWVAEWTQGYIIAGRSILVIFFYIVKFIGFSYNAALDPENGFWMSMLGFTFGVGLCEELCKALPLIRHYRKHATLDASGAVVWGLAAGIGFGVSEGITYSSDFYNGVASGEIYVVRFVSCVALHAVWSGTVALLIWRFQDRLQAVEEWYEWFVPVLSLLGVSMVLHGFYDTFLKRDLEAAALVTALASFALFIGLCEWARRPSVQEAVGTAG